MSIEALIIHIGYPLVLFFIAAEYSGLPLPGESAVLITAATAGAGKGFNIWIVFLFASLGAIIGDSIGYLIGRRGGRILFERFSGRLWFKEAHIRKTENFFAHHGGIAVFFGRWISYLRLLTAIMAGISRMNYSKFLLSNVLSGVLWAGVVSYLGYKFGKHITIIEQNVEEIGFMILIIAIALVAVYFLAAKLFFHRERPRK
jgi:membrane protein DedA with SNARE-associated domain